MKPRPSAHRSIWRWKPRKPFWRIELSMRAHELTGAGGGIFGRVRGSTSRVFVRT